MDASTTLAWGRPRPRAAGLPLLSCLLFLGGVGCSAPGPGEASARSQGAIVGGVPVGASAFPSVGALVQPADSAAASLRCTATRVAPRAVLTAAHCLGESVLAFTTSVDLAPARPEDQGTRAFVHPLFDPQGQGALHDIAILELAGPPEADAGLALAALLAPDAGGAAMATGASVVLVGYGAEAVDGTGAGARNAAATDIVQVDASEIVVGGPGEPQACFGDSGGPAFVALAGGAAALGGVVSRSAGAAGPCSGGTVVTRVDAHAAWIESTLAAIASEGPSSEGAGCAVGPAGGGGRGGPWLLPGLAALVFYALRRCRRSPP